MKQIGFIALLFVGRIWAGEVDVEQYFLNTNNLQANFQQINSDDSALKGKMAVMRGGRFYWHYSGKDGQLIISDGSKIYQQDPLLEQVIVHKQNQLTGDLAMKILLNEQPLSQNFILQNDDIPDYLVEKGDYFVKLIPKKSAEYDYLWLIFKKEQLAGIVLSSGAGDTQFYFDKVKRNQNINQNIFNYRLPVGFDVIEE